MVTPKQAGRVGVQVVCVAGAKDFIKDMLVPVGQTVGWCVNASGVVAVCGDMNAIKMGIWGKVVKPEAVVVEGDRIEVYAPCTEQAVKKARRMKALGIAAIADLGDNDKQERISS